MNFNNKMKDTKGNTLKGGGIVFKEENNKIYILMVYRANHNDWSFPKGHIEPGENIKETVIREILEECGIEAEIIKELLPNKYFNTKSNEETICHMFLLKPKTFNIKPENKRDKVEWVLLNQVREKITYNNLKIYFDKIIKKII